MKNYNRKTAFALTAAIVLTMTACGNSGESNNNTSSSNVSAYQSSQDDGTSSYIEPVTTTTEAETEPAPAEIETTTAETESQSIPVPDNAYDGIEEYVPKDDVEKTVFDVFTTAVKAIKDDDAESMVKYTFLGESLNYADGIYVKSSPEDCVEAYATNRDNSHDRMIEFYNLSRLKINDDGSFVITDIKKIPFPGRTNMYYEESSDYIDSEYIEEMAPDLLDEFGFTLEQFYSSNAAPQCAHGDITEGYFVTFISNINGENTANTLCVVKRTPDKNWLNQEWVLDHALYHATLTRYGYE